MLALLVLFRLPDRRAAAPARAASSPLPFSDQKATTFPSASSEHKHSDHFVCALHLPRYALQHATNTFDISSFKKQLQEHTGDSPIRYGEVRGGGCGRHDPCAALLPA